MIKKPKTKKCRCCKNVFTPFYSSLQIVCSVNCSKVLAKEKAENQAKKEYDTQRKIEKNSIRDFKGDLQTYINKIVRVIDFGQPCLARGTIECQFHGGHVYARSSEIYMAFNLHNIHRQSAQSNHFQNDDGMLREGLTNEYGIDYFNFVSELRRTPKLGLKHNDYQELYLKVRAIYNRIKKDLRILTLAERLQRRNDLNIEIGIYSNEFCIYTKI